LFHPRCLNFLALLALWHLLCWNIKLGWIIDDTDTICTIWMGKTYFCFVSYFIIISRNIIMRFIDINWICWKSERNILEHYGVVMNKYWMDQAESRNAPVITTLFSISSNRYKIWFSVFETELPAILKLARQ